MDPISIATLLKDFGPWGLLALAIMAIIKLDARGTSLLEKVITVAEASKAAADSAASALKDVEKVSSTVVTAVHTLAREQGTEFQTLRHVVGNTASKVDAMNASLSKDNQGRR